jgi:hypothetical protein
MARKTRRKASRRRKQKGGIHKLFTIYTTGTLDIDIIRTWLTQGVLDKILGSIPAKYDQIQIVHFDPSSGAHAMIGELIAEEKGRARVVNSIFNNENFPVETILQIHSDLKDYIIIDHAHILEPTRRPKEFKYQSSELPANPGGGFVNNRSPKEIGLFNSLYLGYIPGDIFIREHIKKLFVVKEDGTIITFRDRLLARGWPSEHELYHIIEKLYSISRKIIGDKYKASLGGPPYPRNLIDRLQIIEAGLKSDIDRIIDDYFNRTMWLDEPVVTLDNFIENFKHNIGLIRINS